MEGFNMNFLCRALKLYFVLSIVVSLFGCSDKIQPATKQSIVQANKPKVSQLEQKDKNQKQIKQKEVKPGAAVKLISPSIITINPDEQMPIEILLEVKETSGELQVELSPPAELNLLDTVIERTVSLASSNTIKIPVTLMATTNGRYYLKIHARINNGDETSTRNLAIIVQVGPVVEKSVQLKKVSRDNVISLPAQETISTQ